MCSKLGHLVEQAFPCRLVSLGSCPYFQCASCCRDSVKWTPASEVQHKVSVVFSFPEEPGKLFNALSAFALREINLTKIESRPFKDDPIQMSPEKGRRFQYRFYIDFAGHLGSTPVQNAIVHLQVLFAAFALLSTLSLRGHLWMLWQRGKSCIKDSLQL